MLLIAVTLDPRCKYSYVEFFVGQSYNFKKAKELCEKVKNTLTKMFKVYNCSTSLTSGQSSLFVQNSRAIEVDSMTNVVNFVRTLYNKKKIM